MKFFVLTVACLMGSFFLTAQNSNLAHDAVVHEDGNWIKMLPDSRVEVDQFFEKFLFDLGLDGDYHFELIDKSTDALGMTHHRYREYFQGNPVEGGTYMLHVKDGYVSHANGKLIKGIQNADNVVLSADDALEIAKDYMDSQRFFWKMPAMEALAKRLKHDEEATFYPEGELVLAESDYSGKGEDYSLAWKFEIYAANPHQRKIVFVDASEGNVLFALEGCQGGAVEGVAETRYSGTQTMITDSISPTEYRLFDSTRGGGIETYDMNESFEDYDTAVDFVDDDNYWDNDNAQFDNAATDAHWGAEMFYDHMLEDHGRDSYDDLGSPLINYVHYGEGFFNAFWNGMFATFGDGDDNPLTSIDVVAHEFTHGVTEYSAGLIYMNESGALNESFSDIFGITTEVFALEQDPDWLMGAANFVLRDMSNPNVFDDPDTYGGLNWYEGDFDNGGVHINSGVQNFWFYLLCEGGQGTNDLDDDFVVDSLGMEIAGAIAYRNLTVYLTESSDYFDARMGSLQAAEDLFGSCSYEVQQVSKAWHAVGLGPDTITHDFQVLEVLSPLASGCDLGDELVSVSVRSNPTGCAYVIDAGEEIEVSYQINEDDPVVETVVLSESLNEGDEITHVFQTPADLSVPDQYDFDFTVSFEGDLIEENDAVLDHRISHPLIFEDEETMHFEGFSAVNFIYTAAGSQAVSEISFEASNSGVQGFLMTGFGANEDNVTILDDEEDNFVENPNFHSKMCVCVDLDGWDEAYLNFDLRQTYSPLYEEMFGLEVAHMIALRVTVDGEQIGDQFHPTTNDSDPYLSHEMDFSEFGGTDFTLCFEGVHFIDENFLGAGDRSTLDNIYFSDISTGLNENSASAINVFPNPTTGQLFITSKDNGAHDLKLYDSMGKLVKQQSWTSIESTRVIDLSDLAKGIYTLTVDTESGNQIKKIVLE